MDAGRTTYKGHLRGGTSVTGDVPQGTAPASFAQKAFDKRWRDLTITRAGIDVGGISIHPDTGRRDWWGECA